MTQLAALLLAIAKAAPLFERLLDAIEQARAEARAADLHRTIDEAIARARASAPVCPRPDCPLARGVLRTPDQPS